MKLHYGNTIITSYQDWKDCFYKAYGKPDAPWKVGKSAESLAAFFTPGLPGTPYGETYMTALVRNLTGASDVQFESGEIEHLSPFDPYPKPRQQDLAIYGNCDGKTLFVGIEAKVDEPFDKRTLSDAYKSGDKKGSMIHDRIDTFLLGKFFNGISHDNSEVSALRYQLFHYLAGSHCESAEIIVMLVIVFNTEYYRKNIKSVHDNLDDYLNFMKAAHFTEIKREGLEHCFHKTISGKEVFSCYHVVDIPE